MVIGAERHAGRSVSGEGYIPVGESKLIPPSSVACDDKLQAICRVKRLMRGDQSPPAQGIHSLRAPPTNRVRSRTLQIPRTSRRISKTSLYGNRRPKSEKSFCPQPGGCRAGKFGESQGGLEGRETPPKGVSLRLQGLPPKSSPYLHLDFDE